MANPFRGMSSEARLKATALVLLAIPVAFLAMFAVGEVAEGDWSGLQHVVEALPLVLVGLAAYRWPTPAGWLLLVVGVAIVGLYPVMMYSRVPVLGIVTVEAVLAMPILAGVLLVLAGRPANPSGR